MTEPAEEIARLRYANTLLLAAAKATVNFSTVALSGGIPAADCLKNAAAMASSAIASAAIGPSAGNRDDKN